MEQKNLRWSSKRFYFFMMAFTLNLILPKKTMDFLNGVQPIFPENWFGVFSKLDFGVFLCLQYFQQWTVQNLLIFSIVLFFLSLLPKAEPLSEKILLSPSSVMLALELPFTSIASLLLLILQPCRHFRKQYHPL